MEGEMQPPIAMMFPIIVANRYRVGGRADLGAIAEQVTGEGRLIFEGHSRHKNTEIGLTSGFNNWGTEFRDIRTQLRAHVEERSRSRKKYRGK